MNGLLFMGRQLVPGKARGRVVVAEAVSFYGEVDPKLGVLVDGRELKGRILVMKRPRGSTVGSYTLYGLRYYGKAPLGIVVEREADPILVTGAVLARIPLVDKVDGIFEAASDGDEIVLLGGGRINLLKIKIT